MRSIGLYTLYLLVVVGFPSLDGVSGFHFGPTRLTRVQPIYLSLRFSGQRVGRATHLYDAVEPNDDQWSEEKDGSRSPEGKDLGLLGSIRAWFRTEDGQAEIQTYVTALTVALVLRFLVVEPRFIPSLSMYPTFEVGDQLAVEKISKRVKPLYRKEVVVFNPPQTFREVLEFGSNDPKAAAKKAREALIKRIVAVEGDKVQVKGGKLYVNGVEQDEPFVAEDAAYEFGPVVVPPGNVLVLGDNRNHSLDGHIWGFLPKQNVIGRAVFVYWPPWRFGNEGMY